MSNSPSQHRICEGEEILINYVPPIYGMPKRKQHIVDEWYFNCRSVDLAVFGTTQSFFSRVPSVKIVLPNGVLRELLAASFSWEGDGGGGDGGIEIVVPIPAALAR
jgi:hypothetical protein